MKRRIMTGLLLLGLCGFSSVGFAKDSLEVLQQKAERDEADAQYLLGVTQDDATAATWYRRAAEQGNATAQNDLSVCYAQGTGVSKDFVRAYAWATVAAAQGKQESVTAVRALAKSMSSTQIEEGQRLAQEYAEKFVKK